MTGSRNVSQGGMGPVRSFTRKKLRKKPLDKDSEIVYCRTKGKTPVIAGVERSKDAAGWSLRWGSLGGDPAKLSLVYGSPNTNLQLLNLV